MIITVKLFATLRKERFIKQERDVDLETTAQNVIAALNLPPDEVAIIMVNGRRVEPDTLLHDGDTIAFFPAVGGG
jgi:sulfur carrier protein